MKITLIHPGISWSGFDTFGKSDCSECNFINHGIASCAAYVSKYGHKVEYIDLRMMKNWRHFEKMLAKSESTVFGISSTTTDFGHAIKISRLIKKMNRKSIVVVGGVHPTIRPKEALAIKSIDYVVTGEGEIVLKELLDSVETGNRPKKRLIIGKACVLEEIPHIDRDLFSHRIGEMVNPFIPALAAPSATILTSRGCPFNCNFCQPAERMSFGGKVRLREMKDVVAELKEIKKKYGLKSFMIHDDLFIISKARILEFVDLYGKSGIKANFIVQGRADLIIRFKEEIAELKKVGLSGIMIGFESGSDRVLQFLEKHTTVAQNIEAAKILKSLKIDIWANYMLGIPTETVWEMLQTFFMIKKIQPEYLSPSLFTPFPATGLYDYCKQHNLLLIKKYGQYRRSLGGDKIKGVNYNLVRSLIFLFYPWSSKVDTIKYFANKILHKNEVIRN